MELLIQYYCNLTVQVSMNFQREQLLCMVDDYLLEKLTEYIILCNGDEERIFVGQ